MLTKAVSEQEDVISGDDLSAWTRTRLIVLGSSDVLDGHPATAAASPRVLTGSFYRRPAAF